jgi:hypothetical protein
VCCFGLLISQFASTSSQLRVELSGSIMALFHDLSRKYLEVQLEQGKF